MSTKLLINFWKDSFTYEVLLAIKRKFMKGFNDSLILSSFLKDENIYGKDGLLVIFEKRFHGIVAEGLKKVRNIIYNPVCDSVLINLAISTGKVILSDIYRFWITNIGTSILTFGILSIVKGIYSIKDMIPFITLGGLLLIFGRLDIELERIFNDSKFIRTIKKILDYNS